MEGIADGLERHVLDERGCAHVREQLTLDTVLCAALQPILDREGGESFTFLPRNTSATAAHDFASGGIVRANLETARALRLPDGSSMMPVETLDRPRATYIVAALQEDARACCIVDEVQAQVGDSYLADSATAFFVGDEVYHLLTARHGVGIIEDVVGRGDVIWHGVSAICLPSQPATRADLSAVRGLQGCLASVREIIVGAYDREGFVIWKRRG